MEQIESALMKNSYSDISKCRISGSSKLMTILELGDQPLANALKKAPDETELKVPLTLLYCPDSSLLQLRETVGREILFSHYRWVTGTSPTTRSYAKVFFQRAVKVANPGPDDLIIEIASNDGTFLRPFIEYGYRNVLGIDPAKNIAQAANEQGVRTLNRFWDKQVSEEVAAEYGSAKVIIARNVIPHVSEVHEVMAGIENALRNDGIGIIEFHYAGRILQELQYDSIYHEHLCYFSIKSIAYLLNKYGLIPFHMDISPISGGSYVIYFSKKRSRQSDDYSRFVKEETALGVNSAEAWEKFAKGCHVNRQRSIDIAKSFLGKTVLGFGASARSSTHLNFCGFDSKQIRGIIDNNPLKQGLYSPGTSIPIISIEEGLRMKPDLIFILAWNFKHEIVTECKSRGYKGEFLAAFPERPYYFRG